MVAKMQQNTSEVSRDDAKYKIDLEIEAFSINLEKRQFDSIIQLGEIANEFS